MKTKHEITPTLGEIFVFEFNQNEKMKQISIGFKNMEEANSFIKTMKDGRYYTSINTDAILIAMEVKNFEPVNQT